MNMKLAYVQRVIKTASPKPKWFYRPGGLMLPSGLATRVIGLCSLQESLETSTTVFSVFAYVLYVTTNLFSLF